MSRRTEQVGKVITQEISNILLKDFEVPRDCLITVSKTEATPDLKHAKVFISVLPENKSGSCLNILNKNAGYIQGLLNRRLHMKYVPRISWEYDETSLKLDRIDRALNQL